MQSLEMCLACSREMEGAHTSLTQWLDTNEAALKELGLDVTQRAQRNSLSGDDMKKLDDLVQVTQYISTSLSRYSVPNQTSSYQRQHIFQCDNYKSIALH